MSQKVSIQQMEELLSQSSESGKYREAIAVLSKYLNQDPDNESICFYLGMLLVHVKNYQSGIKYLERAKNAHLDPGQRLRCLVFLGTAYADTHVYSKAERSFREALQTGVPDPSAYSALGAVFYARKMTNQAIDALKKALDIDPNYVGAINNLGFILCETQEDVEKGLSLCRKAVNLEPQNPAYRDSLAKALMDCGFYKEAKSELQYALELAPNNKIIIDRIKELNKKMELA